MWILTTWMGRKGVTELFAVSAEGAAQSVSESLTADPKVSHRCAQTSQKVSRKNCERLTISKRHSSRTRRMCFFLACAQLTFQTMNDSAHRLRFFRRASTMGSSRCTHRAGGRSTS